MIRGALVVVATALVAAPSSASGQEGEPTKWEQLFFPFPIVGAPPQLEQQVQVFNSYFHGNSGSGDVPSAELAYIASPHLGLVATVPFQIGFGGQTTGFEDAQLLVQWLAAGSLEFDNMLSVGIMGTFPTGRDDLSSGDYYVGPFAYGAQRLFHRLILEGNVTTLLPVVHGDSTRQILGTALVSVLLTPLRFSLPVYVQVETNSTTYLGGTAALPPDRQEARRRPYSSHRRSSSGPSRVRSATARASPRASRSTPSAIRSTRRRTRSRQPSTSRTRTGTER